MKHPLKLISIMEPVAHPVSQIGYCRLSPDEATLQEYTKIVGKPPTNYAPGSIAAQQFEYSNMKRKQLSIEELTQ